MNTIVNIFSVIISYFVFYAFTRNQSKSFNLTLLVTYTLITYSGYKYYLLSNNISSVSDVSNPSIEDTVRLVCEYNQSDQECYNSIQSEKNSLIFEVLSLFVLNIVILIGFLVNLFYFN